MSATAFLHDPACLDHDTGAGHPERAGRARAILDRVGESGLRRHLQMLQPPPATADAVQRVHEPALFARIQRAVREGWPCLDAGDTAVSAGSWRAALGAAGAAIAAVDGVVRGDFARAFALCRPPGHHAERDRAMGFCLFNNVAIAAEHLRAAHGLRRIAIVDWDVHHGNGTQHLFEADPGVYYASLHQWPHYPGTGAGGERGTGAGRGTTLNVPLAAGTGDAEWLSALEERVLPELLQFAPEFVLVSAGFDAHERDPLGDTRVSTGAYATMTGRLLELAQRTARGRLVSVLEGGYDLPALAASVEAHLGALVAAGGPPPGGAG